MDVESPDPGRSWSKAQGERLPARLRDHYVVATEKGMRGRIGSSDGGRLASISLANGGTRGV